MSYQGDMGVKQGGDGGGLVNGNGREMERREFFKGQSSLDLLID